MKNGKSTFSKLPKKKWDMEAKLLPSTKKKLNIHTSHTWRKWRQIHTRRKSRGNSKQPGAAVRATPLFETAINKAPGPDGIPNEAATNLPPQTLEHITAVYNGMVAPIAWKVAKVITLPKPGKNCLFPQNCHPHQFAKFHGQTFWKKKYIYIYIYQRLEKIVTQLNILPNFQMGFLSQETLYNSHCNQNHKIHTSKQKQEKKYNNNLHGSASSTALLQTFTGGICQIYWRILHSFLTKINFYRTLDGINSKPIKAGVPQGSVLSPLLYAISTCGTPRMEGAGVTLYMDDTAIYASDRKVTFTKVILQTCRNKLQDYWSKWAIKFNPGKSVHIIFTKTRKENNKTIKLNDIEIPKANNAKYLGIWFDNKFALEDHIRNAKMWQCTSKITRKTKLLLHKTVIRAPMIYEAEIWDTDSECHIDKLQAIQNKIIHHILQPRRGTSTTDIHEMADIKTIKEKIEETN
ncbi:hypothetical protein PR048_020115 [Dryococelus australis]|uniref:Reverse transcriptase domain-containing protein n=1 Tax=Dryococelus australis TaxID=614101 RepID=A0ABQ9H5I4_9NEOP|nr:hypothetical protein PR048_020115 [Dryococelus australis]